MISHNVYRSKHLVSADGYSKATELAKGRVCAPKLPPRVCPSQTFLHWVYVHG